MSSLRAQEPYDRKNIPILLKAQEVRNFRAVRSFSKFLDIKISFLLIPLPIKNQFLEKLKFVPGGKRNQCSRDICAKFSKIAYKI